MKFTLIYVAIAAVLLSSAQAKLRRRASDPPPSGK